MGTEWTHDPACELEPGARVLVVRPSNRPPALQVASVDRFEASVLALTLPLGEDFEPAEEILLVIHSAGVRFASAARFISRNSGGAVTLHVDGPWRHVDARTSLRFPCAHAAELLIDEVDEPVPAVIADISLHGAGVRVTGNPETSSLRLALKHEGRHATLACTIVGRRPSGAESSLSLVFEEMNPAQVRFVTRLFEYYRAAFMESLALAS